MPMQILIILFSSILFLQGCATIVNGEKQALSISSSPSGAEVMIDSMPVGKTPIKTNVKRKDGTVIAIRADGYQEKIFQPRTTSSSWWMGNILIGGLPGTTTDTVTGSIIEYEQDSFFILLQPSGENIYSDKTQEDRLKLFIVGNYGKLQEEAWTSPGEYISSLMAMGDIPERKRSQATDKIITLLKDISSPPDLADAVVDTMKDITP